jgi:hypothetical protein
VNIVSQPDEGKSPNGVFPITTVDSHPNRSC